MHTFCQFERGRRDTAMTRDCSVAVRSSTWKSTEKPSASSEGITMEQRGRRAHQTEGKVTEAVAGDNLFFCNVCVKCRYQWRPIFSISSSLGNLTSTTGCNLKLRLFRNCVAEQWWDRHKPPHLASEMCNSWWGTEQGSPASLLPH